jgi:hypothetical protein
MAVYFIRAGEDGPVKIGYATNPKHRMRGLQSGNWIRLKLIRVVDGDLFTERFFHEAFADKHIVREWYHYCSLMLTLEPREPKIPPSLRFPNYSDGYRMNQRLLGQPA